MIEKPKLLQIKVHHEEYFGGLGTVFGDMTAKSQKAAVVANLMKKVGSSFFTLCYVYFSK